jgi:acyl dehydratase
LAIDYERLKARHFPDIVLQYGWRDSALYALGLGLGGDPLDETELRYVYERHMQALPTMATVLGHPGFWVAEPDVGINFRKILHGEQDMEIFRPLAPEATLVARHRVEEIIDKGEGRGAILKVRRDLIDQMSGELQSTQVTAMFCRGDGGFGGPQIAAPPPIAIPDRAPDWSVTRATLCQAALIYRLSGDFNPLHADPAVARDAGFDRPILHGLATFGVAGFALLLACADGDAAAMRKMSCRFAAPVMPGETLRTDIWDAQDCVQFRCTVAERGTIVLDHGKAVFA